MRPFINADETVERVAGTRSAAPEGLSTATSGKAESIAWRRALGGVRVPRGVYRFKSHEEADHWLWQMIARPTE